MKNENKYKSICFFTSILTAFLLIYFGSALFSDTNLAEHEDFLNSVEKDTFNYFMMVMNPETGLVKDNSKPNSPCNIAGVGFYLTALCIGSEREWISHQEAREITRKILNFLKEDIFHKNGFYYHFVSTKSGQRVWNSEISSIDTALLMAGILTAGEYFGEDIQAMSYELFDRTQWNWMMNGTDFLCMGWKPETGFLHYYWDRYAEHMILYALAIGSETYPISEKYWYRWRRDIKNYNDYTIVYCGTGSLFTYQYSHAWIDFSKIYDSQTDWWENSVEASLANRQFCKDTHQEYKTFGENSWGITACLGPRGYKSYGAEPGYYPLYDGTVAPCGAAGSIVFTPLESITAMKNIYEKHGSKIYGKYGFKDAYNEDENWFADQALTINQGIILIMIENYRTGFVWKTFMKNPYIKNWIERCELGGRRQNREQ